MTKTRIFSISLIPLIAILGWFLFDGIASEIRLAEEIAADELRVKNKLMMISGCGKSLFSKV